MARATDLLIFYQSPRRLHPIEPLWLSTPNRRWALWQVVAEMVKLDESYGSG